MQHSKIPFSSSSAFLSPYMIIAGRSSCIFMRLEAQTKDDAVARIEVFLSRVILQRMLLDVDYRNIELIENLRCLN